MLFFWAGEGERERERGRGDVDVCGACARRAWIVRRFVLGDTVCLVVVINNQQRIDVLSCMRGRVCTPQQSKRRRIDHRVRTRPPLSTGQAGLEMRGLPECNDGPHTVGILARNFLLVSTPSIVARTLLKTNRVSRRRDERHRHHYHRITHAHWRRDENVNTYMHTCVGVGVCVCVCVCVCV